MTTEILQEVEDSDVSDEKKARVLFDYKQSVQNISAWTAHLLRSVSQEEARQYTLDNINDGTVSLCWTGPLLPHHYREQMGQSFFKVG